MGLKLNTASGGSVSIEPTNTASNYTLTVPAQTGTVAINGPAFSAYQSSGQSLTAGTATKILFQTETFDTNSNFASSRFTPTVAGYYQISTSVFLSASTSGDNWIGIYKNGSAAQFGAEINMTATAVSGLNMSGLFYMNGSTDYLEVYFQSGQTVNTTAYATTTWFNGSMVRAA